MREATRMAAAVVAYGSGVLDDWENFVDPAAAAVGAGGAGGAAAGAGAGAKAGAGLEVCFGDW